MPDWDYRAVLRMYMGGPHLYAPADEPIREDPRLYFLSRVSETVNTTAVPGKYSQGHSAGCQQKKQTIQYPH